MPYWLKSARSAFISRLLMPVLSLALCLTQCALPALAVEKETAFTSLHYAVVDTVTGTIKGRVIDRSGVGIPDVTVVMVNLDTNNQRATRTAGNGSYAIAALPHGIYEIKVSKQGYVLAENPVRQAKTILNKPFEIVPDIVMVTGPITPDPPPPVSTPPPTPVPNKDETLSGQLTNQGDAARRSNVEQRAVLALPLADGRTFDTLAALAAGVAPPPQVRGVAGPGIGAGIGTAGQFAVNGQRARSNNFTVDGSDNNDEDVGVRRQGFTSLVPQSIESVREVQIVTHLWDAEAGRNVGSQVNAISQSGTNRIHGTLYDFFTHDRLNAHNFFDDISDKVTSFPLRATAYSGFVNGAATGSRSLPVSLRNSVFEPLRFVTQPNPALGRDRFQRNQGGGVLGFPVKKDRTFFFGSLEHTEVKARQENHFAVPTIAQRGFLNSGATGYFLDSRRENARFPGTIVGDAAFALFPFPNHPVGPYGENTYTQVLPADGRGTIFSTKLEHNLKAWGKDHTVTGRYNFTNDERIVPSVGGALFSSLIPRVGTQNLSLFLNSQLSTTTANQVRLSFGRTRLRFTEKRDAYLRDAKFAPGQPFLLNAQIIDNLSLPKDDLNPSPFDNIVNLLVSSGFTEQHVGTAGQLIVTPFSPVGADVNLFPQARVNNTWQAADTFTKFADSHTLKLGADVRRSHLNSFLNRNYRPQVVFAGGPDLTARFPLQATILNPSQSGPTPGYFSGSDLVSLGIPTSISQALAIGTPDATIGLRFWQLNFFANDNWRVRRGLTFDYGLRYEFNTVPREASNRIERTFGLDQLPPNDPNLRIEAPFSNQILDSARLLGSLQNTLTAYRQFLNGRSSIYDADRNNLSPRFSLAWDPWANSKAHAGKTAIRAGVGMYYDVNLGSVVSQSRNVFPTFLPYNVDANTFFYARNEFLDLNRDINAIFNPVFAPIYVKTGNQPSVRNPLVVASRLNSIQLPSGVIQQVLGLLFDSTIGGGRPSGGGLAFTLPVRDLRAPYTLQYNLQVERELAPNWLLNAAYVGTRGVKLTRFRTPNGGPNSIAIPIDPLALRPNPIRSFALPPLGSLASDAPTRPNKALGAYTIFDSSAASSYHALQTSLTKRYSQGFQFSAAYTFSHALDDVSDVFDVAGAYALPQDDRNLAAERAAANFDIRHRAVFSLVANLPGSHRLNDRKGAAGWLLGNWQIAALTAIQTGQPFTVNTSYDVNLDGNLTDRINTLTGLSIVNSGPQRLALTANPVRLLAPLGTNGSIGRNTFSAAGVANTDVAFIKSFRLRSEHSLLFRAEAFNVLNRTHFAIPVRTLEAPSFGAATETTLNQRQIQFALKYIF